MVPRVSLADDLVAAYPVDPERDVMLWDDKIGGFGCKITPTGARVLLFQYWSPIQRDKRRRITIGALGSPYTFPGEKDAVNLTVERARKLARIYKGKVADDRDPFLEKQDAAEARAAAEAAKLEAARREAEGRETFGDVADRFLAEAARRVALPEGSNRKLAESTLREWTRLLRPATPDRPAGEIRLLLGNRPIRDVDADDAERVRRAMGGDRPVLANHVQRYCYAVLRFVGIVREANPFWAGENKELRWFEERETVVSLTSEEYTAFLRALDADDRVTRGGAHDALRVLAFSGMRKSEVLTLRRDAVNLVTGEVRLSRTKKGRDARVAHRTLSAKALGILLKIPPADVELPTGEVRPSPYFFASELSASGRLTSVQATLKKAWTAAGITSRPEERKILHSLRHTVGTMLVEMGASLEETAAVLGHKDPKTTQRYAKIREGARKRATERLDAAQEALTQSKDVLPFVRRTAR